MSPTSPPLSDRRASMRIALDSNWTATIPGHGAANSFELSWDGIRLALDGKLSISSGQQLRVEILRNHKGQLQTFLLTCGVRWTRTLNDQTAIGCTISPSDSAAEMFSAIKKSDVKFLRDRRGDPFKRALETPGFPLNIPNLPEYRRTQEDRRSGARKRETRRKDKPKYGKNRHWLHQTVSSILTVVRDGLIPFLPTFIVRFLVRPADFAFICHPRDHTDVWRMFPFARFLPVRFTANWFRFQWPFIASHIYASDASSGKKVKGWIIISPLWTSHMVRDTDLARQKITNAVNLAEKLGARIAGLGAFTSIVTHDGFDLLGKTKIGLTTGNSLSAAVAVANIVSAFDLVGAKLSDLKVAIVGAAGSVGSGCTRALHGLVKELLLIDINTPALNDLVSSLPSGNVITTVSTSSRLDDVPSCHGVVVVTNTIGTVVNEKHLRSGAIVIDCAQPKNVSAQVPTTRKDVIVIESAIIKSDDLDCNFDLDLAPEEALGCLAESITLSATTMKPAKLLGKVTLEQMKDVFDRSVRIGFNVAHFRNSHGYISESDISRLRQYYD